MQFIFYDAFPKFKLKIYLINNLIMRVDFLTKDTKLINESGGDNVLAKKIRLQLDSYLADPDFKVDLPLLIDGTPHQKSVWQAICEIPSGETRSYGDLAAIVGSSPRAVGNACGRNNLPVIIPCHRVITANGNSGGFKEAKTGYSVLIKQWLLDHEKRSNK